MFAFGALIYFIPTMVATVRRHPHQTAIFWLNFFAGWTFLGDRTRVGANAVLAPGTVLAPATIVRRLELVDHG